MPDATKEQKHSLIPKMKINEAFAENINTLNELIATPLFYELESNDEQQDLDDSMIPVNTIPSNKPLCVMIELVKPHIIDLIKDAKLFKKWISSKLKDIEKGNKVYVMLKKIIAKVQLIETEAFTYFAQITHYFLSRAKLILKAVEHPNIEDYRRAVCELDGKEYLRLQLVVTEMRNHYHLLLDLYTNKLKQLD